MCHPSRPRRRQKNIIFCTSESGCSYFDGVFSVNSFRHRRDMYPRNTYLRDMYQRTAEPSTARMICDDVRETRSGETSHARAIGYFFGTAAARRQQAAVPRGQLEDARGTSTAGRPPPRPCALSSVADGNPSPGCLRCSAVLPVCFLLCNIATSPNSVFLVSILQEYSVYRRFRRCSGCEPAQQLHGRFAVRLPAPPGATAHRLAGSSTAVGGAGCDRGGNVDGGWCGEAYRYIAGGTLL